VNLIKSSSSNPDDDDDRDGHQNVGILRTPNMADSPRRLYLAGKLFWQNVSEMKYSGKGLKLLAECNINEKRWKYLWNIL